MPDENETSSESVAEVAPCVFLGPLDGGGYGAERALRIVAGADPTTAVLAPVAAAAAAAQKATVRGTSLITRSSDGNTEKRSVAKRTREVAASVASGPGIDHADGPHDAADGSLERWLARRVDVIRQLAAAASTAATPAAVPPALAAATAAPGPPTGASASVSSRLAADAVAGEYCTAGLPSLASVPLPPVFTDTEAAVLGRHAVSSGRLRVERIDVFHHLTKRAAEMRAAAVTVIAAIATAERQRAATAAAAAVAVTTGTVGLAPPPVQR